MDIIHSLVKEMETEAIPTRRMLQLVTTEKLTWKPHEKSMNLHALSVHLAEIPGWIKMALTTSELDFAKMDYTPKPINDGKELLTIFEASLKNGIEALKAAQEEDLLPIWTMRTGDQVHMAMTKYEVIRHAFGQLIHHRAQLGVYLRLQNISIPGTYGPSADEVVF